MSDLISRQAVIDVLKETGIIQDNDLGHCVVDEINRIPTACNIDAIKRRLKAHAADYKDKSNAYEQGKAFAYKNSARIIDFMLRGGA